ncbi:3-oxoacyl-ACP reductase FabG [Saccharicrinis sp. FJH62]|uniref:3-oxoacyl-ACP reductase FabG n=1 Tax=Saccharicrinis sp. FJH62 TaxID=3344657 RepID=UPI0035D469FF
MKLKGKVALITGASSGIGKAIALRFAAEGATVVVNHFNQEDKAREVVEKIRSENGKAIYIEADISDETAVKAMFAKIMERIGTLDILVNNAGRQKDAPFWDMSLQDWNAVINVDLTGHFLCTREAAKLFLQKETHEDEMPGNIIFITSVHQNIPWAQRANYTAAKAGASMLMKTAAMELAPKNIRVNAVAPGAVKTAINIENFRDPNEKEKILRKIPFGKAGRAEDIASAVLWLASSEAGYITGETLFVDGGMELYADFAHGG